jgi:hypothetical protein
VAKRAPTNLDFAHLIRRPHVGRFDTVLQQKELCEEVVLNADD